MAEAKSWAEQHQTRHTNFCFVVSVSCSLVMVVTHACKALVQRITVLVKFLQRLLITGFQFSCFQGCLRQGNTSVCPIAFLIQAAVMYTCDFLIEIRCAQGPPILGIISRALDDLQVHHV